MARLIAILLFKLSFRSLDQGVITEVVEHYQKERYPSEKILMDIFSPHPNSYGATSIVVRRAPNIRVCPLFSHSGMSASE